MHEAAITQIGHLAADSGPTPSETQKEHIHYDPTQQFNHDIVDDSGCGWFIIVYHNGLSMFIQLLSDSFMSTSIFRLFRWRVGTRFLQMLWPERSSRQWP